MGGGLEYLTDQSANKELMLAFKIASYYFLHRISWKLIRMEVYIIYGYVLLC